MVVSSRPGQGKTELLYDPDDRQNLLMIRDTFSLEEIPSVQGFTAVLAAHEEVCLFDLGQPLEDHGVTRFNTELAHRGEAMLSINTPESTAPGAEEKRRAPPRIPFANHPLNP